MTNMDFRHFKNEKRVHVELDKIGFKVLPMLFDVGESYISELESARKAEKIRRLDPGAATEKRQKYGGSLRERDPWD